MSKATTSQPVADFAPPAPPPDFPQPMADAAYHGIIGEAVRTIAPHTEAAPEAILARLLSAIGCYVGRGPHFMVGGKRHPALVYPIIVGPTKTGCKGQSFGDASRLLSMALGDFMQTNVGSGLSTGQGLAHAVRDPLRGKPTNKPQKEEAETNEDGLCLLDAGVPDKRLLVYEAELSDVLAAGGRDSNNLTGCIRLCWDGSTLRQMVRKDPYTATDPHVAIQADVTPEELRGRLAAGDRTNGFANRFLYVASRRARSLPRGGSLSEAVLSGVASAMRNALLPYAADDDGNTPDRCFGFTPEAGRLWDAAYEAMNDDPGPPLGPLLTRRVPMTRRIAMIYALLDGAGDLDVPHLQAASAVWDYAERSTAWAFGSAVPASADPDRKLLDWIDGRGGVVVARDVYRNLAGFDDAASAEAALQRLADRGAGTFAYDPAKPGQQAKRFRRVEHADTDTTPPAAPATAGSVGVGVTAECEPASPPPPPPAATPRVTPSRTSGERVGGRYEPPPRRANELAGQP